MGLYRFLVDRWGALNYKRAFADPAYGRPDREAFPGAMRTWVPREDQRRLAAYTLFAAYGHNQAWEVAATQDHTDSSARREFGDPAMLVAAITSHMLGREQTITVPGAEDAEQSDGKSAPPEAVHAATVQDGLRAWARAEQFAMRMQQNERKAVLAGDGVYTLAWDGAKKRPRLSVVDPGFYFPDLPDNSGDSSDFPDRVHFAWEIEADPAVPGSKPKLRRLTYELGPIGTATASDVSGERPARSPTYADDGLTPLLIPGDVYDPDTGQISRMYAWNDEPSTVTCYLTEAEWDLDDIKADQDVHTLDYRYATFLTRGDGQVLQHLDLMHDFVPVIHIPNSIPEDGHWGESSLATLLQLFDELQGTDTDSSKASATTGAPMIGVINPNAKDSRRGEKKKMYIEPGLMIEMSQGGNLVTVDTSPQLRELREKTAELQDRLSLNARMPAVALGTLDPTKAPSGFSIQLSYGPMDPLMDSMHLPRDHKYALFLKMVQRLYKAGQHPDWTGPVVEAQLMWGTYKPTDKAATLEMVRGAIKDGAMSLETGVRLLSEVGFPIDDIGEEINRIQSRQFEQAKFLADATGDSGAVGDFLGIDIDSDPEPPTVVLPPAVPGGEDDSEDPAADPSQITRGNE
ncbi:hypothetical protein [Streptomyces sp. NPDC060366]|uniref:hypothetical protein n=1 Tax=Streptomyces sp. NPDC060366 TaxID=3347105 RepID=UPI0036564FEB